MELNKSILSVIAVCSLSACAYDVQTTGGPQVIPEDVSRSGLNLYVESVDSVNHEALVLGIACSAHKYKMNIVDDVTTSIGALDKDGDLSDKDYDKKIVLSSSNSSLKCIIQSVASGTCQAEVNLSGKIISSRGQSKSFSISKEALSSAATCGGSGAKQALVQAKSDVITNLLSKIK